MKLFVAIFLLVAVASIAGFGFVMLDHGMDHGNCPAAFAAGISCALTLNPIDLAGIHAGFLAQFTNTVFAKTLILALIFFALYSVFEKYNFGAWQFRFRLSPALNKPSKFQFSADRNFPSTRGY